MKLEKIKIYIVPQSNLEEFTKKKEDRKIKSNKTPSEEFLSRYYIVSGIESFETHKEKAVQIYARDENSPESLYNFTILNLIGKGKFGSVFLLDFFNKKNFG